ncbi:hypothetical protein ACLOJK_041679 [Asimina triloba]
MAGGSKASIPNDVRKTIQNIKEVASNHTDDEIYAMLQECSMDPDETAQKLLYQDTFHEVKRKRDKRRENQNVNNKEPTDSRWRPGMQVRGGGRGGRGGYTSRYTSHDANVGRNIYAGKENGLNSERGITSTLVPVTQETENKTTTPVSSHMAGKVDGACDAGHGSSTHGHGSQALGGSGIPTSEASNAAGIGKTGSAPPPAADLKSTPATATATSEPVGQVAPNSDQFLTNTTSASVSGVYSSASDPVLVPSLDTSIPGVVGTIKREVGGQRAAVETTAIDNRPMSQEFGTHPKINKSAFHDVPDSEHSPTINEKAVSESRNSFLQGKISNKSQGVERNQLVDVSQSASSTSRPGSSSSRPSSNYGNRSQQVIGPLKTVGPNKEWKPKQMNLNVAQTSSEAQPVTAEVNEQSPPASSAAGSEVSATKLRKKLEEVRLSDSHVIIPNHLHVPEAERCGLSFGSFDASFRLNSSFANGPDTDKSSTPLSESSQAIEESTEEPSSSNQNASSTMQGDYSEQPQSPTHMPENLTSAETDASAGAPPIPEYDQSKPETISPPGGPQYSVIHTSPSYATLGVMPPMLGSQFPAFESSETQAREASRIQGFVVQQPFDPSTSYYNSLYRPGADGDGRFSPFLSPGAATKYNSNITVLSSQTGQSQESGNSLVLSTAGPTLVTQSAGVMHSTIAVTQPSVPVFRQPGLHLSHYPPNYIPYSQYFSPFYVQTPAIHQFLSNAAFPQAGNIFPPPGAAAAAAAAPTFKYPYKPGTNTGNSPHVGMPGGYGPYGSTPTGYSPTPASTTGNSTGSEDLSAPQYKENNVFMTRQQSEGSAVWVPTTPGRDIPSLQASPFYNLPQGQVAYAPAQAGHGAFAGIYHPAQSVAAAPVHHPLLQQPQTMAGVDMVGAAGNVYQQPQQSTVNWANNY